MTNTWPSWENAGLIGEGSFGKVYRIRREEFGKTYEAALKVITIPASQADVRTAFDEGMDEESVTNYFRSFVEDIVAEFALMSELKGNSNIVSYEDHMVVEHEDGIGWDILIRMELLTALPDYAAKRPLKEADVIRLGMDMAKALELCRMKEIVHRDIKPENIFVSKVGDFKLGDFGVARVAEKTVSAMSRKGTYNYMAPEVYRGEEYGYAADMYSVGLVLYRFLNDNRTPFLPSFPQPIQYSDKEKALNRRIGGESIPAPAHGSKELQAVVLKACAFRPQERYGSGTELSQALAGLLAGTGMNPEKKAVPEVRRKVQKPEEELEKTASAFAHPQVEASKRTSHSTAEGKREEPEEGREEPQEGREQETAQEDDLDKTLSVFRNNGRTEEDSEKGTEKPIEEKETSETQDSQGNAERRGRKTYLPAAIFLAVPIVLVIIAFIQNWEEWDRQKLNEEKSGTEEEYAEHAGDSKAQAEEEYAEHAEDSKPQTAEEYVERVEDYLEDGRPDLAWQLLAQIPEDIESLDMMQEERQKVQKLLEAPGEEQLNEYGAQIFEQRIDYVSYDTLSADVQEFIEFFFLAIGGGNQDTLEAYSNQMAIGAGVPLDEQFDTLVNWIFSWEDWQCYTYMDGYKVRAEYHKSDSILSCRMEIRPQNGWGALFSCYSSRDGERSSEREFCTCPCREWQWEGDATGEILNRVGADNYSYIVTGTMTTSLRTGEWMDRDVIKFYEKGIQTGRPEPDYGIGVYIESLTAEDAVYFGDNDGEHSLSFRALNKIYW